MAGYILVDIKTKKVVAVCSLIAAVLFIIGILIGYFSGRAAESSKNKSYLHDLSVTEALTDYCTMAMSDGSSLAETYFTRYLERHSERYACVNSKQECLNFGLPRRYNAYHLNGKRIKIDGQLEDDAWSDVPWSEEFVDIRSATYPAPYLKTKFKMRWNNERLYIAAHLEETNLWATKVEHDAQVWRDNGFEVLMDVDGSMFNYKQIQINALGTMMDQLLYKSPYDGDVNETIRLKDWHPDVQHKVHAEGTVNQPGDVDKYWNVEMAFTFKALAKNSVRVAPQPSDNEVWFLQFGRSEQKLNVTKDNTYVKAPGSKTEWWAWQPCDTVNLHLQNRWGLVQFKRKLDDKTFAFQKWHIYKSLFVMMDAMKKYKAIQGKYTDEIHELDLPPYLFSGTCVDIPEIKLLKRNGVKDFDVIVKSKFLSHKPAHIRSDRYVTFK